MPAPCCGTAAEIRRFGELGVPKSGFADCGPSAGYAVAAACQSISSASSSIVAWARSSSAGSRASHQGARGRSGRIVSSHSSVATARDLHDRVHHRDRLGIPEPGRSGPGRSLRPDAVRRRNIQRRDHRVEVHVHFARNPRAPSVHAVEDPGVSRRNCTRTVPTRAASIGRDRVTQILPPLIASPPGSVRRSVCRAPLWRMAVGASAYFESD